ncbi:F-box/kelch-repeat protein At3g23880-like [Coffea arabica]|uniref:F-box/kelch-repeat protein At3g23880-like n=1 Tax=Coffea arabica TaxID=13443 RepID=A0A6P6TYH0_COFAR|nr:F-box/kelch-repeat protein At3g23880-like [Coffea arabica]XP_027083450.1 F-box/kelch-repeat protein At3g23880-like [Coffea arabica]
MDQYILENILSRLPPKDLYTCQRVCKYWYSIISNIISSPFSILITSPTAVLNYNACLSNEDVEKAWKKVPKPGGMHTKYIRLIGSYNGLICLRYEDYNMALWNPCTGLFKTVKNNFQIDYPFCGFGPNSSTAAGGYVIVLGCKYFVRIGVMNDKLGQYVWKSIQHNKDYVYRESIGVLVNGNLHWPACWGIRKKVILYNLDEGKLEEFKGPDKQETTNFRIGNFKGNLCATFKDGRMFEIWVMKDYRVEESWMWLYNIEGFVLHDALVPLGFLKNGDIIIEVDRRFIARYSFAYKTAKVLRFLRGTKSSAVSFVETLAKPNI